MREVAVVAFAQSPCMRRELDRNEVEILIPVIQELRKKSGLSNQDIDFICSGSSDYLAGQSFAFVSGLDAVGAWPPVSESHVEMDGAFALYEAWVKVQMGYAEVAMVYGFGKPSMGDLPETLALQLDPYVMTPLWPDAVSIAALQARLCLERGVLSLRQMAEVAARDRANARQNPFAQVKGDYEVEKLLAEPYLVSPLRKHDCSPISDGASAMIIASAERARKLTERPAWIRGFAHICEPQDLGVRDLTARAPPRWPRSARASRATSSTWRRSTAPSPIRRSWWSGRSASARRRASTRRGARSRATRSWRPASRASARRRVACGTAARTARWRT
jgi:acetyl-CoA acetyltransferase